MHADVIASFWLKTVKTHDCFHAHTTGISSQPSNQVSPLIYLFIFMHDRASRMVFRLPRCHNTHTDKILTQAIFLQLNLHPGHSFSWERHLNAQFSVSPRYLSTIAFWLTKSCHCRHNPQWATTPSFPKSLGCWGKSYQSLWGCHDICPLLEWFHTAHMAQIKAGSPYTAWRYGVMLKSSDSDVAFLLVLPSEGVAGERVYRLTMVWVHPYQARVSMIDNMWPNNLPCLPPLGLTGTLPWCSSMGMPAQHAPLYRGSPECHDGGEYHQCLFAQRSANWRFANFWVQAPGWFTWKDSTGCQVPVIMSLTESLSNGMTMLEGETNFPTSGPLPIHATNEQESKASSLGGGSRPPLAASPTRALPPKAESQISMTMEGQ